jgi:hypothetical protein
MRLPRITVTALLVLVVIVGLSLTVILEHRELLELRHRRLMEHQFEYMAR